MHSVHTVHAYTKVCLCVSVFAINVVVQEVEEALSHGVLCRTSPLAPSQVHETGKHEIKVEKLHKGSGRRMTSLWMSV